MYRSRLPLFYVLLCVAFLSTHCTPQDPACQDDQACPKGMICKENICQIGCRVARDCPSSLPYCFQGVCSTQLCQPGSQEDCYDGPEGTKGISPCRVGQRTCLKDGTAWSRCEQQQLPTAESCDKLDNDCNGKIDDGIDCTCRPGSKRACYTGPLGSFNVGNCTAGQQSCGLDNQWGRCLEQGLPSPEVCDRKDNDCNGKIDDGIDCTCAPGDTKPCYDGPDGTQDKGLCQAGTQTCQNNQTWGACKESLTPTLEICDDKDNDCDGKIDNTVPQTDCGCTPGDMRICYSGPKDTAKERPCKTGTQTCQSDRKWGNCVGEVIPQTEICSNNIDDDCDGIINNGCEWLTVVRSQEDDRLHGVASNADGHTFLFGHARMDGTLHTQSQPNGTALTQNANQTSHLFLVQLDEAGSLHASHVFAPSYKSVAMASNTKQYAVIAGCGEQNLTIPGQQTYTSNLASNTTVGNIGFLSVLNLSSKSQHPFLTQHVIQFHRHGCIGGVTITDNNEVYVTGWTSGALSFGSWTSTHTDTNSAVFVAKLSKHATNPTWSWTWARVYGTSGLDFGKSIAVTQKGTVYVAGAIQRNNNSQLSFQCLWDQRQPSNCGSSNPPTIHTVNQPNHPIFLMKLNGQSAILEDVIIAGETNKINRMANLPTQQTRNEENTLSNRMLGIVGGIATIGEDVVLSATLKTTGEFGTIKTTTNANGLTTTVLARANASTSPSSMTWAWAKFYTFPGTNSAPERGPYAHQVAVQNNRIFMVGEFIGTSYSFGNNVEIKLPSEASDPIPLLGQWDANGNIMSVQTILGTAQESGATVLRGTHAFPLHLFDGTALTGGHTFAQTLSIQDSSTSFSFSSQPPGTASAYAVRIRLPTTP